MGKRKFEDWLQEVKEIVSGIYEIELEEMPEFDIADARAYYRDRSSPSLYFKECLSEHGEGDRLAEILQAES